MKTLNLVTASVLSLSIAFPLAFSAERKNAVEQYRKYSAKSVDLESKTKTRQFQLAQQTSDRIKEMFVEQLNKTHRGLYLKLQKSAESIVKSRMSQKEKDKKIKQLLAPYQSLFKKTMANVRVNEDRYLKQIAGIFRMNPKQLILELVWAIIGISEQPDDNPIGNSTLSFEAPYAFPELQDSAHVLAFGNVTANTQSGTFSNHAFAIYAGVHLTKAGFSEYFEVPSSVSTVRAESTVNVIDYTAKAIGLLGVGGGSIDTYLEVVSGGQLKCSSQQNISFLFAPLLWFMEDEGSQLTTLSCQFNPGSNGGNYVISSGAKASAYGALPGGSRADVHGEVIEMKVRLID